MNLTKLKYFTVPKVFRNAQKKPYIQKTLSSKSLHSNRKKEENEETNESGFVLFGSFHYQI